jgi:replication factor C subunit 2/4
MARNSEHFGNGFLGIDISSEVMNNEEFVNVRHVECSEEENSDQDSDEKEKVNKPKSQFFISRSAKKIITLDGISMIAAKKKKRIDDMPWVEKYRPKNLSQVSNQDKVVQIFKDCVNDPNKTIPHMVLFGPPGTGKTSTVLAAAKELFGPTLYKKRVFEFNASDDRGIGIVRDKIKKYAETIVGEVKNKDSDSYMCPPYKIIILDEADALTSDAQSALRIIIEKCSMNTRFILICNYIHQITSQILSRCTRFRFNAVDNESIKKRLVYISKEEKLFDKLDDDVIDTIIKTCNGDMRKSITLLQNCVTVSELRKKVTGNDILNFLGIIEQKQMIKYLKTCVDVQACVVCAKEIIGLGYPILSILNILINIVIDDEQLENKQKASLSLILAKVEKKLIDGANEYLQLLTCLIEYVKHHK